MLFAKLKAAVAILKVLRSFLEPFLFVRQGKLEERCDNYEEAIKIKAKQDKIDALPDFSDDNIISSLRNNEL